MTKVDSVNEHDEIKQIRINVLNVLYFANASHYPSNFSSTELIYVFYNVLDKKQLADFVLSKGQAAATLYAILNKYGYISDKEFGSFCRYKSKVIFTTAKGINGIKFWGGAVGQALSIAIGASIGYKHKKCNKKIGVLIGDGELNEGSMWEAIMFAGHNKINNVILIIDLNGLQSSGRTDDIISLRSVDTVMESFGWKVLKINGHDIHEIEQAYFQAIDYNEGPVVIFAKTIKGKGVGFMEGDYAWHRRKMSREEYDKALLELKHG